MHFSIRNALIMLFGAPLLGGVIGFVVFQLTVDWIGRVPSFGLVAVIGAIAGIALAFLFPVATFSEEH